ncbi:hypothetical protein ACQ1P2_03910 [Ornithobacterium rhinotracheale]|uniref:Uncharacterized protein n=1 Tax=Ornithobacterium rhinotracheale (strain ATCC 51463 / DSM 15997 / CCUG 23171 / CIP 104009 / LMG 9086) TaxID=867902 RepID=I4A0B7_ORNRL|nr:hypothetical protein [Ornithobacterium rhinotracheale]AFL97401.1 hypothetical protein Ornrh_1217 [Ornithobacterium rhinotracheale DSM 15997]MCK0200673.1 hypothetical protein [Ornithobacterium rhinotracheale]
MKQFRLNVVIEYLDKDLPIKNRGIIHPILKSLALMHHLDYVIDKDSQTFLKEAMPTSSLFDLVYFRSTENSRIERKQLKKVIELIFDHYNPLLGGVDVYCMYQKFLKTFPFPKSFVRPLNYPYAEVYENGSPTLCIWKEELLDILDDVS